MSKNTSIDTLLTAADERNGFPKGTMASIMQQEVGGNAAAYLQDPGKYHYQAGPDGLRVAGHTGKVSTAFGPFGILESTAKDPGFGVKPLADKSLAEQVRFASDYLAARSKHSGSLTAGLAGYGEGAKYASQVVSRVGGPGSNPQVEAAVAAAPVQSLPPQILAQQGVARVEPAPIPPQTLAQATQAPAVVQPPGADPWQTFLREMGQSAQQPVTVASLDYRNLQPDMQVPQFQSPRPIENRRPAMEAFAGWVAPTPSRRAALLKDLLPELPGRVA